MKVADYIFDYLTKKKVDTVFMVSGGQAMFLNDAVYKHKNLNVICTHHEQSAGMSAEAYGRILGRPAVALVTAGPGSLNVITGVAGAWTDSSPMFVISGQSALKFVEYQESNRIRQHGVQGINIRPIVESITKYFVTVDDPSKILFYLQKAYHAATTGRPGPVWLEVPIDIQRMDVPERILQEFLPEEEPYYEISESIQKTIKLLESAKRPLFILGQGVRLSKAIPEMKKTLEKLRIPVLTTRLGIDIIESDNELYVGRPGTYGERAANFAVQNADLIITERVRQVGKNCNGGH